MILSISDDEHDHTISRLVKKRGIERETKKQIDLMYKNKLKPNDMIFALINLGIELPKTQQLYNYLKQLKNKTDGVSTAKM